MVSNAFAHPFAIQTSLYANKKLQKRVQATTPDNYGDNMTENEEERTAQKQ